MGKMSADVEWEAEETRPVEEPLGTHPTHPERCDKQTSIHSCGLLLGV